jgi:hypothetical protein
MEGDPSSLLSRKLSNEFSVNKKDTEIESPATPVTPDMAILEEDDPEETTQSLSRRYMRMSDNPERMMAKYRAEETQQKPVPTDFKYFPNWCFITFLLTMLSI